MRTTRAGTDRTARWVRGAAIVAVAGLVVAGCSDADGPTFQDLRARGEGSVEDRTDDTIELDTSLIAALERYDSCDAFLADVKERALDEVGPYGFGDGWMLYRATAAVEDSVGATEGGDDEADVAASDSGSGSTDVSGTNVQEQGVDEPDIVKTDGSIMVVVDDATLQVLDVSDPSAPVVLSSSPLAGWNAELLLEGDRLMVLQDVGATWEGPMPRPVDGAIGTPDERVASAATSDEGVDPARSGVAADVIGPWYPSNLTTVTQVDLSDPTDPQVERTWTIEGGYTSARLVDGVARIVVQGNPSASLPFVQPMSPNAEDAAEAANRAVIEASTIEDWIPVLTLTDTDGDVIDGVDGPLAPCDQLYVPHTANGFGVIGVLTADLGDDGLGDGRGVAVLADGSTVYASLDNLYVATTQWGQDLVRPLSSGDGAESAEPSAPWTEVHQFVLDGDSPAAYVASGTVSGTLLDQWSLSEHEGHLRVAVTHQPSWSGPTSGQPVSSSSVVVLARDGDALVETGRVDGLGLDEQIYAVRFMGDVGYVVTFRQVDPLYVLDLSDPTAPAAAGELKITGYSAYLHPVGDGLLLGIGQEATDQGRTIGGQASLFDVSDPTAPERLAQFDLGESSSSEVEHDHRAFLYWDGLALVPVTSWAFDAETGESFRSGLVGIDVGDDDLAERGWVTHVGEPAGAIGTPAPGSGATISPRVDDDWEAQIRRSVVVGDTLFTVSAKGVLASDLASLTPIGWAPLD